MKGLKEKKMKVTSINLVLLTIMSISGCNLSEKNKYDSSNIISSLVVTEVNNKEKEEDILIEESLEEKFYSVLDTKDFDVQTRESLIYIYNTINRNYDLYKEANSFLNMPSKEEYISNNIIDCINNNVSSIKLGTHNDIEILQNVGNANACYDYYTKSVYVKINSESTTESIAKLLAHEILGHANQKNSVGLFGKMDNIMIEGGATWALEMLSTNYSYQNKYDLYLGDSQSFDSYGPDTAHKNNAYYKMFGILLTLTDYETVMNAYETRSLDEIINKINSDTNYSGEYILNLMKDSLKTLDDFESNNITASKFKELDDIVLNVLKEKSNCCQTKPESTETLKRFVKFQQQYMSRNYIFSEEGEKNDVTEEKNTLLNETKQSIVNMSLKYDVLSGYTEYDYFKILTLCTDENNKTIGINNFLIENIKNI